MHPIADKQPFSRMPSLPQFQKGRSATSQSLPSKGKMFICLAAFLGLSWAGYMLFGQSSNLVTTTKTKSSDLIQLVDLPANYLPATGKHRHSGRLVVVGDVHGMKDALLDLLAKVKFDSKHDHLILAGDMISKGPDSAGVVDLAIKLGATGVRGNHEDRILIAHKKMAAEGVLVDSTGPNEGGETQDALEEESLSRADTKDRSVVRALGEKRIKWLKKCPVILRVGKLGDMGEVIVVHAGLAPGVKLEKQDPFMVMNMRTINDGLPSPEGEGVVWIKVILPYFQTVHCKSNTP
jgi:hypothetical protein